MTTTKKNSKKTGRAPRAKAHGRVRSGTTKVKTGLAKRSVRGAAKTDRADKAFKTLLRAKQKKQIRSVVDTGRSKYN